MYLLKSGIKQNPEKRWALPDRAFFGHGACHILAGVYLKTISRSDFHAVWIKPIKDFSGYHIFVTNGEITFDYHGYSTYAKLISHHRNGWSQQYENWDCIFQKINFNLLNTASLNSRKMRGPDQYLHNPIQRAEKFIKKFDYFGYIYQQSNKS